jgi:cytidylate kinase
MLYFFYKDRRVCEEFLVQTALHFGLNQAVRRGGVMDKIVITIARYYGSGGKAVGEMLGRKLHIPFYNKEILRMASDDSGINEALFAQADEKLKGTSLFRIARKEFTGEVIPPESRDFLSNQNLFNYQAKIIRGLADEESCIVIGRCGDYILEGRDNLIRVFIYASEEYCLKQATLRGANGGKTTLKYIRDLNKYRADYHKYYTGRDWNDVRSYDLCLNSGAIGTEGCVEAIKQYIKIRFPEYKNPGLD